ncbi:MAG TPA: four helix bundle protein [Fimbriimonadaceae bacterium]|nr:four helix bundle protein [Fimbriimonadaceae bacterium]
MAGSREGRGLDTATDSRRVPIEETEIFRIFEECADWVWETVETWDWKAQRTVGIHLVRAADSINANLVEGDGRYTAGDALHFFVIARGSARESQLWIRRAIKRRLVDEVEGAKQLADLGSAGRQLNRLISFRRKNRDALVAREETRTYDFEEVE